MFFIPSPVDNSSDSEIVYDPTPLPIIGVIISPAILKEEPVVADTMIDNELSLVRRDHQIVMIF
jgi:hypothetical protein